MFDLKIQGQGHDQNPSKFNQVICGSWSTIPPKMKYIKIVAGKILRKQDAWVEKLEEFNF